MAARVVGDDPPPEEHGRSIGQELLDLPMAGMAGK